MLNDAAFQYDRLAIAAGEWHRFITCHFTHWNADHLVWDVAIFTALALIAIRLNRWAAFVAVAASIALIPLFVWIGAPDLATYRGLSGLGASLFGMLLVIVGYKAWQLKSPIVTGVCIAAGLGFVGKLMFEISTGQTLFVDTQAAGFTPVPLAQITGAVVGATVGSLAIAKSLIELTCEQLNNDRLILAGDL